MIILISGLPGSGKTFFAERLAQRIKALHLSSDRLRKELFPVQRVYSEEEKQSVYQEMLKRMKEAAQQQPVILDATFYRADLRAPFIKAAEEIKEKLYIIRLTAAEDLIKKRTTQQREDSEANYDVYLKLKDQYEPISSAFLSLQSEENNIEEMLSKALAYLR